ncbi:MAG: Stf0 family sulfotransferase, partial [Pseudomonadota bacterium]
MPAATRSRAYILCTAPRSGSTLLCCMLAATGVAGRPGSHLHAPALEGWLAAYDLDPDAFDAEEDAARAVLAAALSRGRGRGQDLAAPFALRLQSGSFPHLIARLAALHPDAADDRARLAAAFGPARFIHLSRPDRLGQALSRVRAEQTGLWHRRANGSELERLAPP